MAIFIEQKEKGIHVGKREIANDLEGILQDFKVTTNMCRPEQTTNLFCYGAILNCDRLESAYNANLDKDWASACEVWEHDQYLSPIVRLLVFAVKRLIEKTNT